MFAVDGEWLGTIEMPRKFRPLGIGEDYILGTLIDELEVPHLVGFGLDQETAPMETAR